MENSILLNLHILRALRGKPKPFIFLRSLLRLFKVFSRPLRSRRKGAKFVTTQVQWFTVQRSPIKSRDLRQGFEDSPFHLSSVVCPLPTPYWILDAGYRSPPSGFFVVVLCCFALLFDSPFLRISVSSVVRRLPSAYSLLFTSHRPLFFSDF